MKIYVLTSNQYSYLLPMYSIFFNKYWANRFVTVLGYEKPNFSLPDNFEFVSIGKQTKNLEPVVRYFKDVCREDYFIMLLEDLFLVDYISQKNVDKLELEIKNGADKASFHLYNPSDVVDLGNGIVEFNQSANYRTNVQAAIWTKEYLLRHLNPEHNWWAFETQHEKTKNDGAKIVFLKEQLTPNALFDAINVYERGRMAISDFKVKTDLVGNGLTHEEDVEILKKIIG